MIYEQALEIAEKTKELLAPHCERIEIAGDIRSKRPEINEIEIVAIPKQYDIGIIKVLDQWENFEGELLDDRIQRVLPEGIELELYFADRENWGLSYALRTGNGEFIYRAIAAGWSIYGYELKDNHMYKDGKKIALYEEEDVFRIIQKPFVEPELRYL
jgi:DNA polymerase/3'-5' exonuclease PolX